MRIRIEGTVDEFPEKREELIKALIEGLEPYDIDLTEVLSKALPQKTKPLKHRAMRDLHKLTTEAYVDHMERMVGAIGDVLDGDVQKSIGELLGEDALSVAEPFIEAGVQKSLDGLVTKFNRHNPNTGIGPKGPPSPMLIKADEEPTYERKFPLIRYGRVTPGIHINGTISLAKGEPPEAPEKEPEEPGTPPDDPDEDPETGEPKFDPKTGLTPSEAKKEKEDNPEDFEVEGEELEGSEMAKAKAEQLNKSGPYIGPRGGKWSDPDHKIPYREVKPSLHALNTLAHKLGGKVKTHITDPNKVVLKLPKKYVQKMMDVKQQMKITDEIIVGNKYAILPIAMKSASKLKSKGKSSTQVKAEVIHEPAGQIPPYAGVPWSEPKTSDEATAWCKGHGIEASFPDLPTAVVVTKALSESHPLVIDHVQFIGTPSQQKAWAKKNPEMVKQAKKAKHAMDIANQSPLGPSAAAVAHPLTKKPYTQSMIVVKSSYWNQDKAAELKSAQGGFSVSEDLGDIVRHELGHVEGFAMRHYFPMEHPSKVSMWEVWKSHCIPMLESKKKQLIADISQYGATNPHEAWAELAVLRRRGTAMPGWVQKALDAMKIDSVPWQTMKK